MKKKLQIFWWKLIEAKRFRVEYYETPGRYSRLMNYTDANCYAHIFGGQVICDFTNY